MSTFQPFSDGTNAGLEVEVMRITGTRKVSRSCAINFSSSIDTDIMLHCNDRFSCAYFYCLIFRRAQQKRLKVTDEEAETNRNVGRLHMKISPCAQKSMLSQVYLSIGSNELLILGFHCQMFQLFFINIYAHLSEVSCKSNLLPHVRIKIKKILSLLMGNIFFDKWI
jgi:hypothetical protein